MNRVIVLGSLPIASMVTKNLLSRGDVSVEGVVLCPYKTNNDPWDIEPLAWFAAKNKIKVFTPDEVVKVFSSDKLDFAFVCRYSKILKNDFIDCFKRGVINFHGGLLPQFSGLYSSCHTILQKSEFGGGTLHYIDDEHIDAGDIIDTAKFLVEDDDTSLSIFQKTQRALYDSFDRNIDFILNDKVEKISQNDLVEAGFERKYFNSKSLNKEINSLDIEDIFIKAKAYDFIGHERAYMKLKDKKIYVTTTSIHESEIKCNKFNIPIDIIDSDDVELKCFRDDYFPMVGGGNKARKFDYIVKYAVENGYNCLVTNGGMQSNHARAAALLSARVGIHCSLVLHTDDPKSLHSVKGNLMMMMMGGAEVRFCHLSELASTMDDEMQRMKDLGYKPLYVWGGGHCVQGSLAYYDAALEAQEQCGEWIPDYIVHASGTGTTQAGLVAGYANLPTKVVGVSVAREKKRGGQVVKDSLNELGNFLNKDFSKEEVLFRDDWTFGGYEEYSQPLLDVIDETAKKGLILDPTYTGKAWYGLLEMIKSGEIPKGSKVLFWHTGGLLNLLSHPAYCEKKI